MLVPRCIFLLEALDPFIIEEPTNCAVERSGAEADAAVAESFDIFHEGVSVPRLAREAGENQEDRLGERLCACFRRIGSNMSHNDMLNYVMPFVNALALGRACPPPTNDRGSA